MNFLKQFRETGFIWGSYDCGTLGEAFLYNKFPGNNFLKIKGEYKDKIGALRFAQEHKWESELKKAFEIEHNDRDYDLLLMTAKGFEGMHIRLGEWLYSMDEKLGLMGCKISLIGILPARKIKIIRCLK